MPGKETCSLQIESFSCSNSVSHTEALPLRTRLGSAVSDSRPLHAGYSEPIEMDIWVYCERLAKHFARQLADGIAYIHSLGAPDGRTKIAHTHTHTHTHTHLDKTYSTFCAKFMIMNVPCILIGKQQLETQTKEGALMTNV